MKNIPMPVKYACSAIVIMTVILAIYSVSFGSDNAPEKNQSSVYAKWKSVGRMAADNALELIQKSGSKPEKENLIVLTNAGYSEADGVSTKGALDGLTSVTGASRGRNTLVEYTRLHGSRSGLPFMIRGQAIVHISR